MNRDIRKVLTLGKIPYYETHLSILNCIIPVKMTPMEIKVMAAFMSLEGDIARYRFGPSARKVVKTTLAISTAGLSNYISSLLESGFLIKTGDVIEIHHKLELNPDVQMYFFKLINKDLIDATADTF